ncbi:MAG: CPBP family intramembrane metalloprotease [Oscillospiraceae bacterium]|nr:CPBP family intramembrane metalloprotease [Oscillospiraceae bacterium]
MKEPWDKEYQRPDPWDTSDSKDPWDLAEGELREPTKPPTDPKTSYLVVPRGSELWLGLIYLPLHMFLIGELIALLAFNMAIPLTLTQLNIAYMLVGTIYLMVVLRRHLRESFVRFLQFGSRNINTILIGWVMIFLLNILVNTLMGSFGDPMDSPNQEVIQDIIAESMLPSILMSVILAPIVEELLFRSLVFAPLRKINRLLAYAASCFLFAFLHIAFFITYSLVFYGTLNIDLFLFVLPLYLPAGIVLCWAYEKSGNVWTAILLHAFWNLIATLLLLFVLPYLDLDPELIISLHPLFAFG